MYGIMKQSLNQKMPEKFVCEKCDFKCSKQSNFTKHIATRKHTNETNMKQETANQFICNCGQTFNSRTTLWRHNKICKTIVSVESSEILANELVFEQTAEQKIENTFVTNGSDPANGQFDFSIMFELIKQNQEFKELIIEQNEKMFEQNKQIFDLAGKVGNTTNNNQNIKNQNNTHFNIQMFLNDKCKDAISLDDFVESLQINTKTAEYAGKHGFVNGITNIFMTGLKQLDVHMRPIHCTDVKRETMYVKGIDIWAKDGETNPTILDAISDVSKKNMRQLPVWIEENPESKHCGTDKFEEQLEIMKGMLDVHSNKEKVLKNLAKEVYIDKNQK